MDTAKKYLWQGLSPLDDPTDDPVSEISSNKVVQLLEPVSDIADVRRQMIWDIQRCSGAEALVHLG